MTEPKLPEKPSMRRFSALLYRLPTLLFLSFACITRAASPVYVGVNYGLLKSTDSGATWNLLNIPLNSPFLSGNILPQWLAMDPQNASRIFFIGTAKGAAFFASPDAGATWAVTPFIGMQPRGLAVDFAGQVIYVPASTASSGPASLYKSTDTGATWTRLPLPGTSQEPSGSSVNNVFADPAVSGTVYFRSANGNHFFKSTDFGSTWTEIIQKSFKAPTYVDPHNPLIWYAVTGGVSSALYKSTDGASSFVQLNIPSDAVTYVSVGSVSNTIYATGDVAGLGGTVLKSSDGGATWTALKNGLFTPISGIVWADPGDPSTVYVNDFIYAGSFYVSTDGGAHFNPSVLPQGPPGCVPGNCARPEISSLLIAASAQGPPVITSVVNGASFSPGVVANSWVTIKGTNLASQTDDWSKSIVNGALPTSLDGVSVSVGGKPAYVYFISPGQLNVLAPDVPTGPISVTVTTAGGTSSAFATTASAYGPAFFLWPNNQVVATRQDFSYAAKTGTFPGATTAAAKPGDVLILWGTGFGPTLPAFPVGVSVGGGGYPTASAPTVTINNTPATVYGAALAPGSAGLYQIAIQVPSTLADGDWPIQATIGGVVSTSGTILSVHQ